MPKYFYQLKPETANCKNCVHWKRQGDPVKYEWKFGYCRKFGIRITDVTNARRCKAFKNKNQGV